jgi:hypothetical protein
MDFLSDSQQQQLIKRLKELTVKGTLEWAEARDEYSFITQTPRFMYVLASRDADDLHPYNLEIWSGDTKDPRLLQTITSVMHGGVELNDFYLLVKRRTLGIDTVAEDVFDDLDRLDGGDPQQLL